MKHTYWAGLFHIAVFALLAVLTPRSLSADPAGHAKSNAIPGEPYFNIATTQCTDYWAALVARTCLKPVVLKRAQSRIRVGLVSWTVQITTAIIAAEVVTKRGNCSAIIEDVLANVAGL